MIFTIIVFSCRFFFKKKTHTICIVDGELHASYTNTAVGNVEGVSSIDPFPVLTLRGANATVYVDRLRIVQGERESGEARLLADPLRPPLNAKCVAGTVGCRCAGELQPDASSGTTPCTTSVTPAPFCVASSAVPYCSNTLSRPTSDVCSGVYGLQGCACVEGQCAQQANCTANVCDAPPFLPTPPSLSVTTVRPCLCALCFSTFVCFASP